MRRITSNAAFRLTAPLLSFACFAATTLSRGFDEVARAESGGPRPIQSESAWQRNPSPLLWNFHNMYQPCVVEFPGEEYRFKMWFFGWAVVDGNPGYPGCDAIFHARSKDLKQWEVYAGKDRWDAAMNPRLWAPIITASDKFHDSWHNGDPSVVVRNGRYYMAFSSTGRPGEVKHHPNDMLLCVMGATSNDGIHWKKTDQPLLIEPPEARHPKSAEGWTGDFHRPSLLWDQGKWRLWFDYWHPTKGVCMAYAENSGEFAAAQGFRVLRGGKEPLLADWPNPEVIKVGRRYHSFSDPSGYPPKAKDRNAGWTSRAVCEAVSDDGLQWKIVGFIAPDPDTAACHVPQALATEVEGKHWLYVFYATQRGGDPIYDFRYDRIRAMRRPIAP